MHAKQHSRATSGEAVHRSNGNGKTTGAAATTTRLLPISAKIDLVLSREIDDYAKAHGITRSRAAGHYLAIASETLKSRVAIPAAKAEELLDSLEGVRTVVELLGPPTFGLLRLLSHWATQGGGLKVSEDELLAELRTVASDEWEQALSEAERELHDSLRKSRTEGAH